MSKSMSKPVAPRHKVVSHHLKRRRAEAKCDDLNRRLIAAEAEAQAEPWLKMMNCPLWTRRFEVRTARLHWHYAVVAVEA